MDSANYFNPRAPCGARLAWMYLFKNYDLFQSTRPVRGATADWVDKDDSLLFQSTRPVRGATPFSGGRQVGHEISIHAPRAGRDHL